MFIQIGSAFFATLFFSILFQVNRKELIFCGIVGAGGWATFLISQSSTDSKIVASLLAALVVSILSNLLAIYRKNPVTTYQISGIIPLVPGAGMYRTAFYFINDDKDLFSTYLSETLFIAGAIALAMLSVYTFLILIRNLKAKH